MPYSHIHEAFHIAMLLKKHLDGTLKEEETAVLQKWVQESDTNLKLFKEVTEKNGLGEFEEALRQADTSEAWLAFRRKYALPLKKPTGKIRRFKRLVLYAASVLLIMCIGALFFVYHRPAEIISSAKIEKGFNGNQNKAVLKLADGTNIILDQKKAGVILKDGAILYDDGTNITAASGKQNAALLELSIPKGSTYQLTLSDGTQVWLNSASVLKYPIRFSGTERVVELNGEAYFSVTKDKSKPFKVMSRNQEVKVLGTSFNISAYADEPEIKTTLIEGSVQLTTSNNSSKSISLKPGQQGVVSNSSASVREVNVEDYVAWKEGVFVFNMTPIDEIMRQISRWYDVGVVYKHGVPNVTFSGKVKRSTSLPGVLDIFKSSSVDVKIEGRLLIVNGVAY